MIVGGVLRIGSSVGVMVGIVVAVAVGGMDVYVAVAVGNSVCVATTDGVGAVPQAERVRLIAKKRERKFFIVHLIEWNYTSIRP
jgi:hypothetical protein